MKTLKVNYKGEWIYIDVEVERTLETLLRKFCNKVDDITEQTINKLDGIAQQTFDEVNEIKPVVDGSEMTFKDCICNPSMIITLTNIKEY